MEKRSAWILGILVATSLGAFLYLSTPNCPCIERISYAHVDRLKGIDLDTLFAPPSPIELQRIIDDWTKFDLESKAIRKIKSIQYIGGRQLDLVSHDSESGTHFGAVILPLGYNASTKSPVLLWAHGLDQTNPSIQLKDNSFFGSLSSTFPQHIIIIPAFRGQALCLGNERYCADGFFGDAYDGATDDALRLLKIVKDQYTVDKKNIAVYGISRGGTVALLCGIRDTSLNTIVCQSGPSQFHDRSCYDRYLTQFKYQFLMDEKPMHDLRAKMIECSPTYFISRYPNPVLVIHGKNDNIVPIQNAKQIVEQLDGRSKSIFTGDGHSVYQMDAVKDWIFSHRRQ